MIGRKTVMSTGESAHGLQHAPSRRHVLYSRADKAELVCTVGCATDREKIINQIAVQKVRTLKASHVHILPPERLGPALHRLEDVSPSFLNPLGKKCVEVMSKKTIFHLLGIARRHEIDEVADHDINSKFARSGTVQRVS